MDDSLRGGDGISSRFLLVFDGEGESSALQAAKHFCESFDDVVELRLRPGHDVVLVRPDGYIAYSAHSRNGAEALRNIAVLLKRQTEGRRSPAA